MQITMVFVIVATGLLVYNEVNAQDKFVLSLTKFTVKVGHSQDFEEGVKAWKACYIENKGDWTWNMWKRYNGEGSVYIITSRMANWAELDDENDEAGKKCRQIAVDKIMPHIEKREENYATSIPEFSRAGDSDWGVIWVSEFRVDNSTIFRETIKEISDLMQKVEGNKRGYWYSFNGGGPESSDYFVTTPYKNFAALDVERDGVWDLVEKQKGKEATAKMRDKFRSSVENSWAYMYKLMNDLSNFPAQ